MLYAFSENFVLVLSHDEVVHGKRSLLAKMPGDYWQQFANLRALYAFLYAHPGKKMLFMGAELGQWIEWNPAQSLDWNLLEYEPHRKLQELVAQLNHLCRAERALHQIDFEYTGFEWIDFHDADHSVIAFLRKGQTPGDHLVVVCNFTPGAAPGLSRGRAGGVLLSRDFEYRRRAVRRKRRDQRARAAKPFHWRGKTSPATWN